LPQELVIHTPENAEIRVPLAGIFSRASAFAYDIGIQMVILFVEHLVFMTYLSSNRISLGSAIDSGFVKGLYLIIVFLTVCGYHPLYELFRNGQTPGKRSHGLRVVALNGQKLSFFSSVLRNFLLIADFLPFLFLAAVFSTLTTERHQRLGDLFAGTVVVRTEE